MPLPAVAVPPSGSCIILLSLAQIFALLLPPPPPLPPLCVCFRPNSLHPYIPSTCQQQPSTTLMSGMVGVTNKEMELPTRTSGAVSVGDARLLLLCSPLYNGLGTRTGCSPWLFLHWQVNSAGGSQPPVHQGAAQQRQDSYFLGQTLWRWNFQMLRAVKPAITRVSASSVDKGVQKSLVAMQGWRGAGGL